MADFCKQCSLETFGKDFGELAGLSTEKHTLAERYCVVICEGCGPCQVDHLGVCVSPDCLHKHGASRSETPA